MKNIFTTIILIVIALGFVISSYGVLKDIVDAEQAWKITKILSYWTGFTISIIVSIVSFINFQRSIVLEQLIEIGAVMNPQEIFGQMNMITKVKLKAWSNLILFILTGTIIIAYIKNF